MSLRNRLRAVLQPRHAALVAQLTAELARCCRERVRSRVCEKAAHMGPDVARGYIRAQAVHCVVAELDTVATTVRGWAGIRSEVASAAVAQLIPAVLGDLAAVQTSPRVQAAA
jgi:hypothetical protein